MQQYTSSSLVKPKTRFLDACHRRQPDATPIWFMRQAGRCLAEYRELRKHYDILTMACYMIEGRPSRDYSLAKSLMYGQPEVWHALMNKLTEVVSRYLVAQIKAGADVVQLFDSWVGALSQSVYKQFVQPYSRRIFQAVKQTGTPSIHFGTGTASLLELMTEAGGDIISVDWRVDLDDAWARIGYERGIQGNLDPTLLLTDWNTIEAGMRDILRRANNRPGHIFNLGHGVLAPTDPDMLRRLVDAAHEATTRN